MGTLIGTLEFGVSALDLDVVQGSLEALASLSRQHYLSACEGQPGIATPQGTCGNLRGLGEQIGYVATEINAMCVMGAGCILLCQQRDIYRGPVL